MVYIKDIKYSKVASIRYCCDRCSGHRTYENSFIHLVVQKNSSEDDWEKVPCFIRKPSNNHLTSLCLEILGGEHHDFIAYLNSGERIRDEDFVDSSTLFYALKYELSGFLGSLIEKTNLETNNNNNNNNKIGE